ncbi:HEAT repeat domain-containing protein [Sorangium sp. So ce327]|uniref:HEAT repeat domain-containing protein n=1 Tax=Sorangium sp. So ce327 TaxID=3133301 RepID=UPI003F600386
MTPPPPPFSSTAAPAGDPDVDMHLGMALNPHGNRPDLAQKAASIQWLVDHAERAYPIVLARAEATPSVGLVSVLGRFARAESTPVLARALVAGGLASGAAGTALGEAPDPRARAALIEALGHTDVQVVTAALNGLRVRGDRSVCADVVAATRHPDGEVRWMAVSAGAALGCLDRAALRALAEGDADPYVRKLAARLSQAP